MKTFFLYIALLMLVYPANAQRHNQIVDAELQIEKNQRVSDSIISQLIHLKEDSLSNDSLKVDVVRFLAKYSCDSCLLYLIEHIDERFNYGLGSSDLDQSNHLACWTSLARVARNNSKRWIVLSSILYSLSLKERDDGFFSYITPVLTNITSKKSLKEIFLFEIQNSEGINSKKTYKKNLETLMLRM